MVPCKETPTFQPEKWRITVKPQGGSWRSFWGGFERRGQLMAGPQASWPICLSGRRPRRSSWGLRHLVFVAGLWSRFSVKGSQPHEECFCVISETAVEDVDLGHQCKRSWEKGQSTWAKALFLGALWLWYQRRGALWCNVVPFSLWLPRDPELNYMLSWNNYIR